MPLSFEIQNRKVQDWALQTEVQIKSTAAGMGIQHRSGSPSGSASIPKIKARLVYDGAAVRAVAFRFPRSIIYPHHGAGRGQGGRKGSSWYTKNGVRKRTNPESLGKEGTGRRKAKPFLNDTLNKRVPVLADIVASTSADTVTANLFKQ